MLNRIPDGMLVALLGDFGSAKDFEDLQVLDIQNSTVETTLAYNSPEQVRNPHNVDGVKDMWSFGCVALEVRILGIYILRRAATHFDVAFDLFDRSLANRLLTRDDPKYFGGRPTPSSSE